jgi:hypothetical protein
MKASEDLLLDVTILALIAITGAILWFLAWALRWKFPGLSLPGSLVVTHTCLLLICVALLPTGIFFADPPFDDLYFGYFLYPGIHIYLLSGPVVEPLEQFLSHLGYWGAILEGLVIPGLIGVVVGGAQWYLIGKLVEWLRRRSRVRHIQQQA